MVTIRNIIHKEEKERKASPIHLLPNMKDLRLCVCVRGGFTGVRQRGLALMFQWSIWKQGFQQEKPF